jgi:hypothetical protein
MIKYCHVQFGLRLKYISKLWFITLKILLTRHILFTKGLKVFMKKIRGYDLAVWKM